MSYSNAQYRKKHRREKTEDDGEVIHDKRRPLNHHQLLRKWETGEIDEDDDYAVGKE